MCEIHDKLIYGTQHRKMLQTLKWSKNGELSELDMNRVMESLKSEKPNQVDITQMGKSNPRWRKNSLMQD